MLETPLGATPVPVIGIERLSARNIDPEAAARSYRERVVKPYRGVLPDAALRSIEEQLSGACTMEIAAFDEFSKLLGDATATAEFDHVIFDTAPTGHTLRLLELPAAWTGFLESNAGGTSCLGPLAGLMDQRVTYEASRRALVDADGTAVVLVSRPERTALAEAERTRIELTALGVRRLEFVLNGLFSAYDRSDPIASALEERGRQAIGKIPTGLASLPRTDVPLLPFELVGVEALRALLDPSRRPAKGYPSGPEPAVSMPGLASLIPALESAGRGLIMTMGKGGVGKTSVGIALAVSLAERGHEVLLTTTDPAADPSTLRGIAPSHLRVGMIDPEAETLAYVAETMRIAGASLDAAGRALLEEDLRSPCTEEVAVFRAFARTVDEAERGFVVIDTAPTGHTLLLLDAAEAYHREVLRTAGHAPEEVRRLLPRLRDPAFTRILLVTLPEATPVHEAASLQRDLERAGIHPFAWVVNQSFSSIATSDPVLRQRRARENKYLREVASLSKVAVVVPWTPSLEENGAPLGPNTIRSIEVSP